VRASVSSIHPKILSEFLNGIEIKAENPGVDYVDWKLAQQIHNNTRTLFEWLADEKTPQREGITSGQITSGHVYTFHI